MHIDGRKPVVQLTAYKFQLLVVLFNLMIRRRDTGFVDSRFLGFRFALANTLGCVLDKVSSNLCQCGRDG